MGEQIASYRPSVTFSRSSVIKPEEQPSEEVDYALDLPRPYPRHLKLLQDLREAERQHIDPERFRYTIDTAASRIVTEPEAVIALHILELKNVSIRVTSFTEGMPMFFYCYITIGNIRRLTNVTRCDNTDRVRVDSLLHFSINVSQYRDSPTNKMRIELWAFQDPEIHYIISTQDVHIFQLIREIHSIHKTKMWSEGLSAGTLIYEYAFLYGAFGYGHSNQLRNTEYTIFESVSNSLFPRIANSSNDITESNFHVLIPKKLHLMSPNSFIFEKSKKPVTGTEVKSKVTDPVKLAKPKVFKAHQVEIEHGFPVHCKTNMKIHQKEFEAEFNDVYGEFVCFTKRRDRLEFLNSLLEGRLEDLKESSAGTLFMNLEEGVIEPIINTADEHSQRIYPFSSPCTDYPPAIVMSEDEEFFQKFPMLTRTTGWLGRLFGFSPLRRDPHFLEPAFPLDKCYLPDENKTRWYRGNENWLSWTWRMLKTGLNAFYLCLFPELRNQLDVPEISITLASPEGSTTDLYVRWYQEENEDIKARTRERIEKEIRAAAQKSSDQPEGHEQFELDELADEVIHDEVQRELSRLHHHPAGRHSTMVHRL